MDIQQILTYLTPFLVLAGTWIALKLLPLIPGWLTITVVTILSAILTYLAQLSGSPDLVWYAQFGYGMLAIVLSQIIRQFSPEKVSSDKQYIRIANREKAIEKAIDEDNK